MTILETIKSFSKLHILVIGDTMIDAYYIGKIDRMSPEAPVPILAFDQKDHRPGGAANVALNLKSLGAQATICSVVGNDAEGIELKQLLELAGIKSDGIVTDSERPTTVKTRVIAGNQHLLRMDHETTNAINSDVEDSIIKYVRAKIKDVDAVIFEDYNKGLLTERLIREITELANINHKPSIVDPKKDNFFAYKNCTLFKPNRKEITEGLQTKLDLTKPENVEAASTELMHLLHCNHVMVTLSEDGVYIKSPSESKHVKAHKRTITDVSGAGDTVVSVAALCLAAGMDVFTMAEVANIAGGLVCEKVGVVPIKQDELESEVIKLLA